MNFNSTQQQNKWAINDVEKKDFLSFQQFFTFKQEAKLISPTFMKIITLDKVIKHLNITLMVKFQNIAKKQKMVSLGYEF